ncbi:MAG: polyphosphate kinase 1 [Fusobacteria bacterium]|nr:polyphosphate kinase 1 [Fusobacteriota bacterium]
MEYINRELSWLEFNSRVLSESVNSRNPLLERVKFLAITASNMDEFFMVRIGGIKHKIQNDIEEVDITNKTVREQSIDLYKKTKEFSKKQYNYLLTSIIPKLNEEGIIFVRYESLEQEGQAFLTDYFMETVYPILTPLAVDPARPLPFLQNLGLNLVVKLSDDRDKEHHAFIQVPGIISRFIEIPECGDGKKRFVLLEELMLEHVSELFEGYKVVDRAIFRITRDAFLHYNEDETEDLLNEIKKSLKSRRFGGLPVRVEIQTPASSVLENFLIDSYSLLAHEVYRPPGFIDLKHFFSFYEQVDRSDLKFSRKKSYAVPELSAKNIFDAIKEKDILLHHPFNHFDHVVDFIEKAANDPSVLAIKQTLYRVSGNSPIIRALIKASELGKQVTVLVELKARFDEERNIDWARQLEKAGCNVVYGLLGLKVHAKVSLIVRREEDRIVRYAHIGTGNYNNSTANVYTDIGILTISRKVCSDISKLFNIITGYSIPMRWESLAVAPFNIRTRLLSMIEEEKKNHELGYPAKIIMKMNSLVDKQTIDALYEASTTGVEVQLIVRGVSCLSANVPGQSENIMLKSVVGRYLEHSRIYCFENRGNTKIFLSSADCMDRNFDRRIEIMLPIESHENKEKIMDILDLYLMDTENSFVQQRGHYESIDRRGKIRLDVQQELFNVARQNFKEYMKTEFTAQDMSSFVPGK